MGESNAKFDNYKYQSIHFINIIIYLQSNNPTTRSKTILITTYKN